ncbi:glycogen synthase (ADP-glucose) [Chthoniobacter flavus]|uniref:glycogen synthase GlgA n=1 Tax=Chthoniobacter flavus TaxID=191863 RepID=UPI00104DCD58|nr:glycogen synthase GlgA [Chthoniobacter flavus]TCO88450.1 glycogen synthase (ADP-glucose) [Chthoniobacter flavus]
MKILFTGSEMAPLARTGGLGDVLEALPAALAADGHEVSVVLPCYRGLPERKDLNVKSTGVEISVSVGYKRLPAEVLECTAPNGVQVFLLKQDEFFDRTGLYGTEGHDYPDNAERFIYFSRAVVELARRAMPPPDILHVHDWQVGLIPALVKEKKLPFKTVLTIHNLAYQGSFWGLDFGLTNLPGHYFGASGVEFYGNLNLLKGGIVFADAITTVSERYAREIQTPEGGAGLDAVMREHAHKLTGILNGVDYEVWDPATDEMLPKKYSAKNLAGKEKCREALLEQLGLAPDPTGPVLVMVTRLTQQKGIELLFPVIDRLLADDVRLVILGEGDLGFESELMLASRRHADRFAFRPNTDEKLSHLIYAGGDVFLMPSQFEPCGLSAMYALRYGTLPIAHATGGLYESIQDYDPTANSGHGFLFYDYNADAFWDTIMRMRSYFTDAERWKQLQLRAMACDFSWASAVPRYEEIYTRVLRGKS